MSADTRLISERTVQTDSDIRAGVSCGFRRHAQLRVAAGSFVHELGARIIIDDITCRDCERRHFGQAKHADRINVDRRAVLRVAICNAAEPLSPCAQMLPRPRKLAAASAR